MSCENFRAAFGKLSVKILLISYCVNLFIQKKTIESANQLTKRSLWKEVVSLEVSLIVSFFLDSSYKAF